MNRKQFTFYRSFFSALQKIRKKAARCDAYDAICNYALNGQLPDMDKLEPAAAIIFELIQPVLESGAKRSNNAHLGITGRASKSGLTKVNNRFTTPLQTLKEKDNEVEIELEVDVEKEIEIDAVGAAFERFWDMFPKKVGKQAAKKAFEKVPVSMDTLEKAIEDQKQSAQWQKDGGVYIPNPATWLSQHRWEDQLPEDRSIPKGASGKLGKAELENIQRILKEEGGIMDN